MLLASALLGLACQRQSQQPAVLEAPELEAEIRVDPVPARVGPAELRVMLSEDGQPVEGATISVRGDMSHAGMTPVFGEAVEIGGGLYRIPFEWTMGGDWIVNLSIELADGREIERTFELAVASEG